MDSLKEKFASKALPFSQDVKKFLKEHGDKVISEVTVAQVYGGLKGVPGMVSETPSFKRVESKIAKPPSNLPV